MSLITIEEFTEFADANPELADAVRNTYDENGSYYYDTEWNSFVDEMTANVTTCGGMLAHYMYTVV